MTTSDSNSSESFYPLVTETKSLHATQLNITTTCILKFLVLSMKGIVAQSTVNDL